MSDQNAEVELSKFYDALPRETSFVISHAVGRYSLAMYDAGVNRVVHVEADAMLEVLYLGRSQWMAYQRKVAA